MGHGGHQCALERKGERTLLPSNWPLPTQCGSATRRVAAIRSSHHAAHPALCARGGGCGRLRSTATKRAAG